MYRQVKKALRISSVSEYIIYTFTIYIIIVHIATFSVNIYVNPSFNISDDKFDNAFHL